MLSVLPKRINDESLVSYILRLTVRNGFNSPYEWVDEALLKATASNALTCKQLNRLNKFFSISFNPNCDNLSSRHSVIFHNCHFESPRVCPVCVKGTGYLKDAWRYIGNLKCDIHNTALIDICHICGEKLVWAPLLLESRCTNEQCSRLLRSSALESMIDELFIDEICDCLLADYALSNPFCTYWPTLKHPKSENLISSVKEGFSLLTNKSRLDNYVEILCSDLNPFNQLAEEYKCFPLNHLIESLKASWPIIEIAKKVTFPKSNSIGSTANIKNYIVTVGCAMSLLGLSKSQLMEYIPEIAKKKVLPSTLRINIAPIVTSRISWCK